MTRMRRVRVMMATTAEGGRRSPISDGYRASWQLGDEDALADALVDMDEQAMLAPGETGTVLVTPLVPEAWERVEAGDSIKLREGRRVVGQGQVLS